MKKIALFTLVFLFTLNSAIAQCGVNRARVQEKKPEEKSSVVVPEGTTKLKDLAQVSKREAKKIATENYSGKVKKANLANENGHLVWKLEVKGKEGQKELFIDPANGEFLGFGLTK